MQNTITIQLARPLTEDDLVGRTFFMTILIANRPEVGSGYTFLYFDLPPKIPAPLVPLFEKPIFRGDIDLDRVLTMESVIVDQTTYSEDIEYKLETGQLLRLINMNLIFFYILI